MNTFTITLEEFTKNNELDQNSIYGKMIYRLQIYAMLTKIMYAFENKF